MAEKPCRRIAKLPFGTQTQIASSVQITSLTDVVLELVKNSLDAKARQIEIRLDLAKGYCSVLDDGIGIEREEFLEEGGLAKLYYTSKLDISTLYYGRYGRFLASLSGVSLVAITSLTCSTSKGNKIVLRDGRRIATNLDMMGCEEFGSRLSGTKITVYDLFGKMPVRVKHRSARLENRSQLEKEFVAIKKVLVALLLAFPRPCMLDLSEMHSEHRYVHRGVQRELDDAHQSNLDINRVSSTLSQAGFTEPGFGPWEVVTARTEGFYVRATFCLQPVPTKELQFLSIGQIPVHDQILLNEVNLLFDASSFGTQQECKVGSEPPDSEAKDHSYTAGNLRSRRFLGSAKCVDRWPIFYIRVESNLGDTRIIAGMNIIGGIGKQSQPIIHILKIVVSEFLQSNSLRTAKPRAIRQRRRSQAVENQARNPTVVENRPVSHGFDSWSRMKSSRSSLRHDVQAGLPFLTGTKSLHKTGCFQEEERPSLGVACSASSASFKPITDGAIEWIDPCTKQALLLDACTGMVLPEHSRVGQHSSKYESGIQNVMRSNNTRLRDIRETAKQLTSYSLLPTSTEPPVLSITQGSHFTAEFGDTHLSRCCPCSELTTLEITAPTDGEAALDLKITKESLKSAKLFGQVDGKFILASVSSQKISSSRKERLLVLIDQHAADERVKVEELYERICLDTPKPLVSPIIFEVPPIEAKLFREYRDYFSKWSIHLKVCGESPDKKATVCVTSLPQLIAERCRLEPKLLIDLLRKEIWTRCKDGQEPAVSGSWLSRITKCPQGVLDMLSSRACRSAIMFNDTLDRNECQALVHQLSRCFFPFQCAHGRPSMTILARLSGLDKVEYESDNVTPTFGQAWSSWTD